MYESPGTVAPSSSDAREFRSAVEAGLGQWAGPVERGRPAFVELTEELNQLCGLASEIRTSLRLLTDVLLGAKPEPTQDSLVNHAAAETKPNFVQHQLDGISALRSSLVAIQGDVGRLRKETE